MEREIQKWGKQAIKPRHSLSGQVSEWESVVSRLECKLRAEEACAHSLFELQEEATTEGSLMTWEESGTMVVESRGARAQNLPAVILVLV